MTAAELEAIYDAVMRDRDLAERILGYCMWMDWQDAVPRFDLGTFGPGPFMRDLEERVRANAADPQVGLLVGIVARWITEAVKEIVGEQTATASRSGRTA